MPTKLPRITITVNPETRQLLQELEDLSGQPASSFIRELLEQAGQQLFQPMIQAMKLAKDKKDEAWDVLNNALAQAQHSGAQLSLAIHEEKRKAREEVKPKRRKNATKT